VVLLILVSACGRFGFAVNDDVSVDAKPFCVSSLSHDEDGDGVNDDCDPCPQIFDDCAQCLYWSTGVFSGQCGG
jgi:hypothetical protein